MTNVIPISSAHPLIALLDDMKLSVLRGEFSSCIFIAVDNEAEPFFASIVDPDDDCVMIGMLEKAKLEIMLGVGAEDDD